MNIGEAVAALKDGKRVARIGWNGKGMWLSIVEFDEWALRKHTQSMPPLKLVNLPWVGMKTAQDTFVPWLASQTDLLAEDWEVVS